MATFLAQHCRFLAEALNLKRFADTLFAMPLTDWGWEITEKELRSWIIQDDDDVILFNKPPLVVCHPSKKGPWSSLVGACRECLGYERTHLIARLDRETSGIILLAKHRLAARHLQMALEKRATQKRYLAVLEGKLTEPALIDASIGKDPISIVHSKSAVRTSGRRQEAQTRFTPLLSSNFYTLAQVEPITGRKHQIRVHAQHLGHSIVGDKLYGPDESLFLEFIESGWTENLAKSLPLNRHALHAYQMSFELETGDRAFIAPLSDDLVAFCQEHFEASVEDILERIPS
ncbi:MAG TPA: RNA pseudouridine synthase [Opitutae bacterium]|nr:RNA pseudouridine synthase [Myxococcales bacterium]HCR30334.1 RNA pseudouridine synthase [Opitutae bacterium]